LPSEYLLGDFLLVAPVLEEGATSRDIYLPSGRWQDQVLLSLRSGTTILEIRYYNP
jgi:alpha-glucosidase (family GH31 glycosyl hydrolase)